MAIDYGDVVFHRVHLDAPVGPDDAGKVSVADLVINDYEIKDRDIVVIASKVVAILEGSCINLDTVKPSKKTKKIARVYNKDPRVIELIRREGRVSLVIPGARLLKKQKNWDRVFSLFRPGLTEEEAKRIAEFSYSFALGIYKHGYLCDSAGIDYRNVPEGYAVLLPKDPTKSAQQIRDSIKERTGKTVAVVITDSLGGGAVLGSLDVPIGYVGIDPVERNLGAKDVYGAICGGVSNYILPLSSMSGIVIGNTDESTPITIIRGFKYNDPRPEDEGKDILSYPVRDQLEGFFWVLLATIRYFFVWLLP